MGKSVEVQRSQVDELFKSMKGGDELPETDPRTSIHAMALQKSKSFCILAPELATKLYPHQKKALTFMLERECEIRGVSNSSLWQERYNPASGEKFWHNIVTQKEVFEEPTPTKGAILADDVREESVSGHIKLT